MKTSEQIIENYWQHFNNKTWCSLFSFFTEDAEIIWPNTNEEFSVARFVEINEKYPGNWSIDVEKMLILENLAISVVRIFMNCQSFHAISFFTFTNNKISLLQEYWSEDTKPPLWRE